MITTESLSTLLLVADEFGFINGSLNDQIDIHLGQFSDLEYFLCNDAMYIKYFFVVY